MSTLQSQIDSVKRAKATKMYWEDVRTYGREQHALRALDCANRQEAIEMLVPVQTVSIFKHDGKVIIQ